jgi:hypothetical protein
MFAVLVLLSTLWATPAAAQYGARLPSDRATGEDYNVEFMAALWNPAPSIVVSSESLGIIGTDIDFETDLGIQRQRFPELRLVLRSGEKHKFRLQYIPIKYTAQSVLQRTIVFNGIRYDVGLPVNSEFLWKAVRFGYEWDFVYLDRGFAGFIAEAKYTSVSVTLDSPAGTEFTRARAPIPALGGITRIYVAPNIGITLEITGFKLPESIDEEYRATYIDFDLYGTVNFTNNVGAQIGYRSLDVTYTFEQDAGDLTLKGLYFAGVVRF